MAYTLRKNRVRRPAPLSWSVLPPAWTVWGKVTPATSFAAAGSGSSKLTARATTARVRMAAPPCARPLAPDGRNGNAGCRRSRRVREMMRPVGRVTPNTGATRPAETAPLDGPPELLIRLEPLDGDRRPRAQVTRGFVDLEQLPPDDVRLDRHGVPV